MVNPQKETFAYEKFYGKMPDYNKYLKTFGEVVVVCSFLRIKFKLKD